MMAGLISNLASALLGLTTSETGVSLLPRPLARRVALLASDAGEDGQAESGEPSSLIREAVTLFRVASQSGAASSASRWHLSSAGDEAALVLPRIRQDAKAILKNRRNLIQIVTMNHPGLATITKADYYQGFPYAVASLGPRARGLSRYATLPMAPPEAERIVTQVAKALEYAHHRGLIHGSLSPDDIFIGSNHSCNVLGVGWNQLQRELGLIVRPVAPSPVTPPEAIQGGQPDKRSDVYAVGALLFWLLTGKQPVPSRPVRISQDNHLVPEAIDKVLTRSLAKSPSDRYASMGELTWELRLAARSRPATPRERSAALSSGRHSGTDAAASAGGFPESLPLPPADVDVLNQLLIMPEVPTLEMAKMPTPPEMPHVDWVSLMKPVDISQFASASIVKPHVHDFLKDIPDPLQAAAEAARIKAEELEAAPPGRDRAGRTVGPRPQSPSARKPST